MKSSKPTKPCKRCDIGRAKQDEKYCSKCASVVRAELQSSGYLTDTRTTYAPKETRGRSQRHSNTVGGSAELNSDGDEA